MVAKPRGYCRLIRGFDASEKCRKLPGSSFRATRPAHEDVFLGVDRQRRVLVIVLWATVKLLCARFPASFQARSPCYVATRDAHKGLQRRPARISVTIDH